MRLKKIMEEATAAAVELKAEAELIGAVAEKGNEAVSIENARKGFQTILRTMVPCLGDMPKTKVQLESRECFSDQVARFIEGFHSAIISELGKCEFLEKGSDKFVYGRFISKASNNFLRSLQYEMKSEKKRGARLVDIEINFDEQMMDKLAVQNVQAAEAEEKRVQAATMLPPLPRNFSSKAFQKNAMPVGKAIQANPEYEEIMARLKREGKIL